jgi:hypothetical protein
MSPSSYLPEWHLFHFVVDARFGAMLENTFNFSKPNPLEGKMKWSHSILVLNCRIYAALEKYASNLCILLHSDFLDNCGTLPPHPHYLLEL